MTTRTSELNVQRSRVQYQDLCDVFRVKVKKLSSQYYNFYAARLAELKPLVLKSIDKSWNGEAEVIQLSQLVDHVDEKVIIIGILFKQMTKQPTILKEIAYEDNENSVPLTRNDNYTDDSDSLKLQDADECINLHGNLSVQSHVTGVVIGLLGYPSSEENKFYVEDFCYPMLPDPWSNSLTTDVNNGPDDDKYILIISGLGFSRNLPSKLKSALDLLSNYLVGILDPDEDDKPAKIIRLIIAGNLIGESVRAEEEANDPTFKKPWLRKSKPYSVDIMSAIDDYLVELGKSIDVEIMPGSSDITNISLPQQPIHPTILPRSSICSAIRSVTNPYAATFDSRLLIGNCGQTIDNIRQYSNIKETIEIMEKTINWSHLAPTAPDTLSCYPIEDIDPFILRQLPDVYFSGNQEKFASSIKEFGSKNIRLISVPKFEKSFAGALLNLNDLTCDYISFNKL